MDESRTQSRIWCELKMEFDNIEMQIIHNVIESMIDDIDSGLMSSSEKDLEATKVLRDKISAYMNRKEAN